ncbi:HlyD family secretion protein [Comamonas thiooxydans]|uniref:HlyD family secretion protein n=1 Tax=Comamonas thiooxydans TaxID=363952 RepID=A0AA42Q2Z0_9BURK|nr:HlyD family secretion protein [Comamonas thiooxydans]MDH1335381.1 HlyD family secretion protein [Comamonas thiooxydans]MDH1741706.1 HlyD family secretion protein [Comamonas thiooxydans]MDH1787711.1 HlyD family secretion protein [Comamonas thiooxydans]
MSDSQQPHSPAASAATAAPSSAAALPPTPKKIKPSLRSVLIMLVVALAGMLLVLRAWNLWPFNSSVVTTDNAYVRGAVTVLAPQVNGYVTEVLVKDYEQVKAGQALVRIDSRSYEAAVAQAQAQLANAQAQLSNSEQTQAQNRATLSASRAGLAAVEAEAQRSQAELKRVQELAERGSVSLNERDKVRATSRLAATNVAKAQADIAINQEKIKATTVGRDSLKAQVQMAEALLRQAQINLDNTVVHAPSDGQVSEVSVRKGQYVAAGTQLMYVVPPTYWVVANYKETQTARVQIGQVVSFSVDALGGLRLKGHVQEIAPATGSEFSVLKADNATGNFTKVVQRLPIKIAIDEGQADAARLRPGMSVIVRLDTAQKVEHSAQTHQAIEANSAQKPQAPAVSASEQAKP